MRNKTAVETVRRFLRGEIFSKGYDESRIDIVSGDRILEYHKYPIAKIDKDHNIYIKVYNSKSTYARLNCFSGVYLHNIKGDPHLGDVAVEEDVWIKL